MNDNDVAQLPTSEPRCRTFRSLQHAETSSLGVGVSVRLDVNPFSASSLRVASDAEAQEESNDPRQEEVILYPGDGTRESPFVVDWDENDPQNPYNWSKARKWPITALVRLRLWNLAHIKNNKYTSWQWALFASRSQVVHIAAVSHS